MNENGKIIVVLGMHRSGTSAITRGLQLLGVGLGGNLQEADTDNPKGFWEDKDCLEINEEILAHLGSAYDKLSQAWEKIESDPVISKLKLKAIRLLSTKLSACDGVWGFKDPRTSRLLSFWQDVFRALDCQVGYVIVLRNPASIVDSLLARNSIPAEKTYFLWLQHILPAIMQTANSKRVIVDYDELLDAPSQQMNRVASALELSALDPDSPAVLEFENKFLDNGLRHTRYSQKALSLDSRAPTSVIELYKILSEVAQGRKDLSAEELVAEFAGFAAELARTEPVFSYANQLERERAELWGLIAERQRQLEELTSNFIESEGQRERLQSEYQSQLEVLTSNLAESERQREGLHAEGQRKLEKLKLDLMQLEGQLGRERLECESRLAALNQGLIDARRELHIVLASKSWTITKPFRAARRIMLRSKTSHLRQIISRSSREFWHWIPVDNSKKLRFKDYLFGHFPSLVYRTQAYRAWLGMNSPEGVIEEYRTNLVAENISPASQEEYVPLLRAREPQDVSVRLIAFYLPQFHAIQENDEWWGEGFTEWSNVKPARPQFEGHYQPHVPGELGYYNLLDGDVQRRQIELAKLYGISGFCFYYYWFAGKRLLEQPIDRYLKDSSLDHPFCLCWANENWSRRWDGLDSQILISQQHSAEDDLAIAEDFARHMRDPRYIRIDGKPILLVYRPSLLPSALETSNRWREWFRENGIGEIYLAYTQSFETEDPRKYGFDAAIEFPPNNSAPPNITSTVIPDRQGSFTGTVYDWSIFPLRAKGYQKAAYRIFRSVCPSWDNTARRKNNGTVFLNSSPAAYKEWLESAIDYTCQTIESPEERLIFVNAWNEWAEGAHLEPDQKYGYAWLDATRRALTGEPEGPHRQRIIVVSHDAHPHGAQFLALGMVRSLVNDLKLDVAVVLLGDGRLKERFAELAPVYALLPGPDFAERAERLANELVLAGFVRAILNTVVAGSFCEKLSRQGVRCVSLIHEMPGVIRDNGFESQAIKIAGSADRIVFPASIVEQGFSQFASVSEEQRAIRPQGLWRRNLQRFHKERVRQAIRAKLGATKDAPLVLAVGYADRRKGIDLFVRAAIEVLQSRPDALFVWIGHWDENLRPEIEALVESYLDSFRFLGYQPETASYHAAADVYALTSREDPFPNVVLESFDAGVPVVAFGNTGGGAQLVSQVGGTVVEPENPRLFGKAIFDLLEQPESARQFGMDGSTHVDREYAFRSYLFDICNYAGIKLPKVSVIVPNFNYAHHIRERLDTIIGQTLPIFELIILDDASTDNSVEVITDWLEAHYVECRLVINEHNSGCVFDQWAKGVGLASGDFIWIAEADDLSEPRFLETVIAPMERDGEINLSYCESQQIDAQGKRFSANYHGYVADVCDEHWRVPFVSSGKSEIARYLAIKNTIPNVSGVLFRRDRIAKVFTDHMAEIGALGKAGDWLTYIRILSEGKIAFNPRALNQHRRHGGSVIGGSSAARLVDEISSIQLKVDTEYSISAETREQAVAYLKQLRQQFKLNEPALVSEHANGT